MNWKWWVGVQLCILAYLGEIVLPFSEYMLLSVVYKLNKQLFWAYFTCDLFNYLRLFLKGGTTMSFDPKSYQNLPSLPIPGKNAIPSLQGTILAFGLMILAFGLLVAMIHWTWVKPIRSLIHLRRRILREILHVR